MKLEHKALLFNFSGFAVLFLIARFGIAQAIEVPRLYLAIGAAIFASVLSPKFVVIQDEGKQKLMMKSIFMKSPKEL